MNEKATRSLNHEFGAMGKKPAVSLNQIFDQLATKKPEPAKGTITKSTTQAPRPEVAAMH